MTFTEWKKKKEEEERKVSKSSTPSTKASGNSTSSTGTAKQYGTFTEWKKENSSVTNREKDSALAWRDDEIAPVKEQEDEKPSWFDKGAFEDGYQFGDIFKTAVGTIHDVTENVTTAVFDATENLIDTTAYGVGVVGGLFDDDFQDDVGKFIAKEILAPEKTGKFVADNFTPDGFLNQLINKGDTESASVLGEKADGLVQSGAHMVGSMALQTVGVPMWLTMGVNSFGSEIESAYQNDATHTEAGISGGISALAEIVFERISGGIKFKGMGTLDDGVQNWLKNNITNKVGRAISKYAVDVVGEGTEEVLTELASGIGKKLTYMDDKEFNEIVSTEDAFDAFIGGAIMGGVAGGVRAGKSAKTGRDFVSDLTANEEKVVKKIHEDEIAKREANGDKLSSKEKNDLWDEIVKKMNRGYIDTDTIESVLGGESYESYKSATDSENALVEQEKALQDEYKALNAKRLNDMTGEEQDRREELKKILPELQAKIKANEQSGNTNQLKSQLSNSVFDMVKGKDRLVESYNEKVRAEQDYVADLDKFKGAKHEDAAKKTIENAIKAGANNTNAVHDIVDMAAELSSETGYVYDFQDGDQIKQDFIERKTQEIAKLEAIENPTDAQTKKLTALKDLVAQVQSGEVTVNGNVDSNGIVLNLDSAKPLNRIVGHEITHTVEKAKHYDKLRDSLFAYAKSKGVDIDAELEMKALEYEGVKGTTAEAELVADLVGDYLFTDSDFVKQLTTDNRNVAQRIYDEIKYFLTKATQGSKEERELLRVKHEFEKAFRESAEVKTKQKTNADSNIDKYSFIGTTKDGRRCYESGFGDDVSADDRILEFKKRIATIFNLGAVELKTDVKKIRVRGDKFTAKKNLFGDLKGQDSEQEAKINSLYDLADILATSKYDPSATAKEPSYANPTVQPKNKAHKDVKYWYKFRNEIVFDGVPYTVTFNIRDKGSEQYQYLIDFKENKTSGLNNTAVNSLLPANQMSYEDSIAPLPQNVKSQPSESASDKYSLSKDSDGNQLSKEQRDYFKDSKAVDENGNLRVVYHGTYENFNVFDIAKTKSANVFGKGHYFTSKKADAQSNYATQSGADVRTKVEELAWVYFEEMGHTEADYESNDAVEDWNTAYDKAEDFYKSGRVVQAYLNIKNPVYARGSELYDADGNFVSARSAEYLKELGYDGIIDYGVHDKFGDFQDLDEDTAHYVVFDSNQIKLTTNKIPTTDPDIRFSLSKTVEETKDLVAVHNLQSSELFKTLEYGGLPMPSIAIIKATQGHENYGDVSLVFHKQTIDPQYDSANKVYGGDAWTPVHPRLEYKVNDSVQQKIKDKYYALADKVGYDTVRPLYRYVSELEGALNSDGGETALLERLYDDTKMMQVYLEDSGKGKVEDIVKETRVEATEVDKERNQWFIDKLGEDVIREFATPDGESAIEHRKAFVAKYKDEIASAWESLCRDVYNSTEEQVQNIMRDTTNGMYMRFVKDAAYYLNTGGITIKTETDYDATNKAIKEKASDGYKAWVDNLFKGVEEKTGIRNDKDVFTSSGNRRSWDALHWENTLENVVRAMKAQDQTGADAFVPSSALFAVAHKKYGSVDEIKADSHRLGKVAEEEYKAMEQEYASRLADIADSIKDNTERNSFFAVDEAAELIVDAVRNYKTKAGMLRYMKQWNNRVTESTVDDIVSLVNDIANMPTGYFEAKPQRAVGLEEVGVFVIPKNGDSKLKQELLNRGYSIAEYDPNVEGDRQRVVNQFEELKFSLSNANEDIAPIGNFDFYGKDFKVKSQGEDTNVPTTEDIAPVADAPFPDEIAPMTEEEANAVQDAKAQADAKLEGEPKTRKQLHSNIINDFKATFSSGGYDLDDVLKNAKNLSTLSTVDNTPQRVMEKALGYKEGQILSDLTVNKVAQNETEGIKWLNNFTDRKNGLIAQISKQYNIKPASKESAAAQMYAEGFYVNDNNDIVAYGDAELAQDFPDAKVQNNIKGLANDPRIRRIYDETLDAINKSRKRNAYPEIQRLDNYYLHFRAMTDTFSQLGLPFNPNDIRAKDLPTDLNGVTADLKPGQPYFASANHRKGKRTSFDLLGGLERYLTAAKNQIYHIDDIQNLRALRNYIADTYGQANGLEGIDALTEEEAQERIEQVYGSHLSTFAKFLNEEANVLAGKTALIDRGLEGVIGRRGMTFLDTVNKQTGSNMVGFNISSSLTNFIPVAQTFAKTNKFDFTKAFAQTVSNKIGSIFGKGDNFAENSPVVIRRKGADRFYRTPFQKVADSGYVLMSAVDDISTELIARTKFNEFTRKGMSEQQAHFETDKWVSRLMGDRSLGQMPQLYNSKTLGIFTKFQLEVRNQLDAQFYDTIQEAKVSNEDIENALARNAKTAAKVTSTFVQLAVVQHLFGKAFESVAGYNPAFDIISVLATMFGFDDDEESEDTARDNIEQGFLELLEDLPYTSAFTGGGRIPISSALPITEFIQGKDSYGNEKSRLETLGEAAPYYVLPTGYGQIKKTAQGLGMFSDEHPVAGSYTDSGNLRFPVEDTIGNRIQAGIFGQYANKNAREYFDNGYAPLKEKQIQEYVDVELPIADYWNYREGLKGLKSNAEKADYINSLDIQDWQKNLLMNNILDRKEDVDMSNYDDYSDFEEFDYAQKNPEKYAFAKSVGGYSSYQTYSNDLNDIKADKDENGKSITGSRKEKVLNYINNLNADYETKIILFKSEYPSDDTYNAEIINHVNNRDDLTYEEKMAIFAELGFTVKDGYVYWD